MNVNTRQSHVISQTAVEDVRPDANTRKIAIEPAVNESEHQATICKQTMNSEIG